MAVVETVLGRTTAGCLISDRTANFSCVDATVEALCAELNDKESRADIASHLRSTSVELYVDALAAWWRSGQIGEQHVCRMKALGAAMSRSVGRLRRPHHRRQSDNASSSLVAAMAGVTTEHPNWFIHGNDYNQCAYSGSARVWDNHMSILRLHEARHCMYFSRFKELEWQPSIFWWAEYSTSLHRVWVLDVMSDVSLAASLQAARPYGPPPYMWRDYEQGRFRAPRAQALWFLWTLQRAVLGFRLDRLRQIVDFGAGTGEFCACLYDLGYASTYFVLDFPEMLLLQLYFLRYSGIPAFLGAFLQRSPDAVRGRVVLEETSGSAFAAHFDWALAGQSLFFATWSFTEADMPTRERIRPLLKNFGVVFIAFVSAFDCVSNDEYLRDLVDSDLARTHGVMAWRMKADTRSYFLVAVHRDIGSLVCAEELDCSADMLHPLIGRRE